MDECKFDLQPLYCDECGAFVGNLGTCEDHAWCERCNSRILATLEVKPSGYDLIYSPQEERGKPPMQVGKIPR
jgi:DNA-directed RNA polymerase subunit RPC12/RpoP